MEESKLDRIRNAPSGRRAPGDRTETEHERLVLLVDDNDSVRESLALLFRMAGFEVVEASSGKDALALLESRSPALIVTDLQMPEMHGAELIARARKIARHPVHIIAISVHGPEQLEKARDAGADAWVDKLADVEELLEVARRLVAR